VLTAESIAWFQTHGLPKPDAFGIVGTGALMPVPGDSNYVSSILMGLSAISEDIGNVRKIWPYFDGPGLNLKDPLVSPVYSPSVLAAFPP